MSEIDIIKEAIEVTKKRPKNYTRNKILSHLEDALAHAYRLPQEAPLPDAPPAGMNVHGVNPSEKNMAQICICPPGARDFACSVHGS